MKGSGMMMSEPLRCRSCGCELHTREVREVVASDGRPHAPFCERCAKSAEGISFAQWLDEQWQRSVIT